VVSLSQNIGAPTVLQSLNQALHQLMAEDQRVVVLGEDLLDPYGGAFKVTQGLSTRFPDRVVTTPISEAAIVGVASGLALRGARPIAEIMFGDFLFLAGDQLVNHAAKFRWMYADQVRVPLVVRAPMGGRRGYGPTHSQSIEKHFMGVPGLWVVAPHVLGNPGDLLRRAVGFDDPVIFIESKACYGRTLVGDVSGMTLTEVADDGSPFPAVHLSHDRAAADGMMWCYGAMVPHCLEAIARLRDEEGVRLDLAVVSQLSPMAAAQVRRLVDNTQGRLFVYVEEASAAFGWSAEMLACVQSFAGDGAGLTHVRVGAADSPIPSSRDLERQVLPEATDLVARVLECL
jgi:pyruvate/2-oxoglutarate/acetoin dehydrogenase E1 component